MTTKTTTPSVDLQRSGSIATLVINNPARRNAMNQAMWQQLLDLVTEIEADAAIRVVVVRGAGDKAFSAGADISEFAELVKDPARLAANNEVVQAAQGALENLSRPTIAMIHGACVGGGCGLSLACDFRLASSDAKFGITPAKLGLLYSLRDTRRLYNLVGPALTREMLYTGKILNAEQAQAAGLLTQRLDTDLAAAVDALAAQLSASSQFSIRGTKSVLALIEGHPTCTEQDLADLFSSAFNGQDCAEGSAAFLEKRPAEFRWG